jgi:hypothetical protein
LFFYDFILRFLDFILRFLDFLNFFDFLGLDLPKVLRGGRGGRAGLYVTSELFLFVKETSGWLRGLNGLGSKSFSGGNKLGYCFFNFSRLIPPSLASSSFVKCLGFTRFNNSREKYLLIYKMKDKIIGHI